MNIAEEMNDHPNKRASEIAWAIILAQSAAQHNLMVAEALKIAYALGLIGTHAVEKFVEQEVTRNWSRLAAKN